MRKLAFSLILSVFLITLLIFGAKNTQKAQAVEPTPVNLINNPSFENLNSNNPIGWSKGKWGTNTATFSILKTGSQDASNSANINITKYTSGDAKWFFTEVNVKPSTKYTFSDYYISNVTTEVDLRYTATNGQQTYVPVLNLAAANSWTKATATFTTPSNVKSLTVFHLLEKKGILTVDNFSLTENPSSSPSPSPTNTPSPTPSSTVVPTAIPTASASPSPVPTATATISPTATASPAPTSTPTATAVPTQVPTASPSPTFIPTSTPSPIPTDVPTLSPSPSPSPTVQPTSTAIPTALPTPSATPTATAVPTQVPTASPSPTFIPTSTPTATPVPSASPSATPSLTPTASPSPSATPSPSPTPIATPSPTPTEPVNLIANSSVEDSTGNDPAAWARGGWGTNTAVYTYPAEAYDGVKGIKVEITNYTNGDVKWYFNEVPVTGDVYTFSDSYKSNVVSVLTAQFHHTNGSFTYEYIRDVPASTNWQEVSANISIPSGVSAVSVFHLIQSVGYLVTDAHKLVPATSNKFNEGMVSFNFDDGYLSIYQNAIPKLNTAGIKSTQYIISETLYGGYPDYVNASQVFTMYSMGHEIGNHTVSHPDLATLSAAQLQNEVVNSKTALTALGIPNIKSFAYPYGSYNPAVVQKVIDAGHTSGRAAFPDNENFKDTNKFELMVVDVQLATPLANVKNWIDKAKNNKSWVILMFHQIDLSGDQYSTTPTRLQEIIDYVVSSGVKTVTNTQGTALMNP